MICGDGCGSGFIVPHPGQRGNGGWVYARHRNSFTVDELWGLVIVVHVSGAGGCNEYSHAPFRELKRGIQNSARWREEQNLTLRPYVKKRATGRKEESRREFREHDRAGNGPADCRVATTPECIGAKIFQTSHRQSAEVPRRDIPPDAFVCFLHKIKLESPSTQSQSTSVIPTPVS